MTICEHCSEQVDQFNETKNSTGGYYGDTYASHEWIERSCPNCGCDCQGVYVEDELLRRYFRRFGFPKGNVAKHVTVRWL